MVAPACTHSLADRSNWSASAWASSTSFSLSIEARALVVEAADLPLEFTDRPVTPDAFYLVECAFERVVDGDHEMEKGLLIL